MSHCRQTWIHRVRPRVGPPAKLKGGWGLPTWGMRDRPTCRRGGVARHRGRDLRRNGGTRRTVRSAAPGEEVDLLRDVARASLYDKDLATYHTAAIFRIDDPEIAPYES